MWLLCTSACAIAGIISFAQVSSKNKGGSSKEGFHGTHGTPSRSATGLDTSPNQVGDHLQYPAPKRSGE